MEERAVRMPGMQCDEMASPVSPVKDDLIRDYSIKDQAEQSNPFIISDPVISQLPIEVP